MHTMGSWTMFSNMISSAEKASTKLTKDHLVSEAILMFVAGTDTTATSLTFTLHHLLQDPVAYRRLQEEVKTVLPSLDSRPPFQDLDALPFLDACIKEGIRMACPSRSRLPRSVPEGGWTFKGHYFPPKVSSFMSPFAIFSLVINRWLTSPTDNCQPLAPVFPV